MYADQAVKERVYAAGMAGAVTGHSGNSIGERPLEVPTELERLSKAVEFASHSLAELCNRLEGKVVRGSEPTPAPTTGGGQLISVGPSTMFGQEVRGNSSRIESMGERIQDLLRRLEV